MKKHLLLLCCLLATTTCVYAQNRYQVVITEIMADPAPIVGLPNNEWIELKNTGTTPVNLAGWRLGDLTGISGPMPQYMLASGSYVIICTGNAVTALSAFGATLAVTSFPSLDNETDQLFIRSANGTTMHAVNYQSNWYNNELKKEGGWTLEMIDPVQPCSGKENWKASTSATGGTPGTVNSVNGSLTTQPAPAVTHSYTTGTNQVTIVFNQPVDSSSGATLTNYSVTGNNITRALTLPPLFNQVQLTLAEPLTEATIYTISVSGVINCSGKVITAQQVQTGLASAAMAQDLVINEILFRPRPNGYDYAELYNRSKKIIDLSKILLANRNTAGNIDNIKSVSQQPVYIFPGDYVVVTENADNLALNYLVKAPSKVMVIPALPSYPNTGGTVVLVNEQGAVVDEVAYSNKWHFPLIDNDEGVALERIDPDQPSQSAQNWHSAASTAGFGTPTYRNSQYKSVETGKGSISISPTVFSPDGDGFNDITSISYNLPQNGFVANITIFDAAGRPVKNLVRNATTSTSGYWNWNGLNDKNNPLPIGTYIILSEFFNLQGKKQVYKNTVVLARPL
ncbi:lamin tail domain-containing protein [Terrimonas rubra]|uniref:Lamin tail domain-containing protein n=1 Tax=Terrimonas rubra TaxID=1035890 RepID=A0ABW6A3H1_9BACT